VGKRLLIAPLLCVLAASAAGAQAPNSATRAELIAKLDQSFGRVDVDKDGSIGRAEVAAIEAKTAEQMQANVNKQLAEQFGRLASDKNGQLSLAEFQAGAKVRSTAGPDAAIKRLDTNKDGKVSRDEYGSRELAVFDSLDANKDGTVTAAEAEKAAGR
jgi:Ca2+-binding EF-hand superfamily protein